MLYQLDPVSLDLKHVSFKLFSSGSETHNRGKLPIKIVFFLGETELFSIFYKPRDAQVDEKIIQTFSDLNALSKEEKSSDAFLPVYKIVNLVNNGESLSLWEFIEGEHLQGNSAGDVIKILSISEQEKKSLYQQLLRLESVCTFLNISDLHLENLVFTHLGQGSPQVIPVDLESAQPGNATGLFSIDPEILPFTKAEITILEKSKERIGECSVRFVPIPTSHFLAGLTRCDSFVLMASFIQGAIQKKSYALCIPKDELEWLVLNDFLHNDVPYLTEYKSQIYYVTPSEKKLIARRS